VACQHVDVTIDQEQLDDLWDFADPAASEVRLRAAGEDPELRTQVARALGLKDRFAEARVVLDSISDVAPAVQTRVALERGRLANSSGAPDLAIPLFAEAERLASAAGLEFLEIDAIHMLAIADSEHTADHARRGLERVAVAQSDRTRRWAVALHNNRGWSLHDTGEFAAALEEFEEALFAATEYGTPEQRFFTRWAVARCYRSLGRYASALALQQELAAEQPQDPDVLEELGILRSI
jgi:tetratricopeptide (TPR) repeat protein